MEPSSHPVRQVAGRIARRFAGRRNVSDKLYLGSIFDRFAGLEFVLPHARGATVLDVGCCEGLIAYEFARAGCSLVHGIDIDRPSIDFARKLFRNVPVPSVFVRDDVAVPFDRFERKHAELLLPRYDIVLFLGLYHHLAKQMSEDALRSLVAGLLARSGTYFVARSGRLVDFEPEIMKAGFECVGESPKGTIGLLRAYRRGTA